MPKDVFYLGLGDAMPVDVEESSVRVEVEADAHRRSPRPVGARGIVPQQATDGEHPPR
jgi:hypothetical protein